MKDESSNHKRILVFPDLHQAENLEEVDLVIAEKQPDLTVFLGDYFDHYGDAPEDAARMARWLKGSLAKPDRIHLLGNHDIHYASSEHYWVRFSGFREEKLAAIREVLCDDDFRKMRFALLQDRWLFTHAGLTRATYEDATGAGSVESIDDFRVWLSHEEQAAQEALHDQKWHWFWGCDALRGGMDRYPGIVWSDFRRFQAIPGLNQVFGHTRGRDVRRVGAKGSRNYCIDTRDDCGWRHYLIMQANRVRVGRSKL